MPVIANQGVRRSLLDGCCRRRTGVRIHWMGRTWGEKWRGPDHLTSKGGPDCAGCQGTCPSGAESALGSRRGEIGQRSLDGPEGMDA